MSIGHGMYDAQHQATVTLAHRIAAVLCQPATDYAAALVACLRPVSAARVALIGISAALSWWVYVPIHELFHVAGCVLTGGTVTRLDLGAAYGAAWLQRIFPFVSVGSDYAGQLVGFDTHGSDLCYLATDLFPYLLTVGIGVPLLHAAARPGRPSLRCAQFGAALPIAFAPFISIAGDYYEVGSILATRIYGLIDPAFALPRWRSDDVIKLATELFGATGTGSVRDAVGVAVSLLLGAAMAWATYLAGCAAAKLPCSLSF